MVTANKTEDFADTIIINPPAEQDTLIRLYTKHSIDVTELSKCLTKKAETLANSRNKIQKPGGIDKIMDFRKRLNRDIKEVGTDGEIDFLVNLVEIFTSLSSISNERVLTYFTDVSYINAKVSYLDYKLAIARDNKIVREHDVIIKLISLIETLTKKPRLDRSSSSASSSTIDSVDEEVVDVKGFFW
jgi:hypothetical protein